jgi:hypothetical protein
MRWSGSATVKSPWSGQPRKFRINLVNVSARGSDLGYGGEIIGGSALSTVIGGLNDWGNPDLMLPSTVQNAVCSGGTKWNLLNLAYEPYAFACSVTFASQTTVFKRGLDPEDPQNWVVQSKFKHQMLACLFDFRSKANNTRHQNS